MPTPLPTRSQSRRRRGRHRRVQRGVSPDAARVAGHRRPRPGAAVRDRRVHLPRAGPRLPGQPVADDDRLRPPHGRPLHPPGAGRRALREERGQPGGGVDAGAAHRPEAQGRVRHELGRRGPSARPRGGPRADPRALRSHPRGALRAFRHPHPRHPAGRGHGPRGRGRRGRLPRGREGHRLRHRRRADPRRPYQSRRDPHRGGGGRRRHLGPEGSAGWRGSRFRCRRCSTSTPSPRPCRSWPAPPRR